MVGSTPKVRNSESQTSSPLESFQSCLYLLKLYQSSILHSRVQIQFRNIHSLPASPQLPIATAKPQANILSTNSHDASETMLALQGTAQL